MIGGRLSRRRFMQGLAAGLAAGPSLAASSQERRDASGAAAGLSGTEFDLDIGVTTVNITGRRRPATTVNGMLPGPVLHWREGDALTIRVRNRLSVATSIHWHGILLPADMDGVPGLSFPGIAPGETFVYRFTVRQHGTYWYHAHSGFQEQTGLYGPIIIEPRHGSTAMQEHVVMLSDWMDQDPSSVFRTLRLHSDAFDYGKRTLGDFLRDAREQGLANASAERRMWGEMRMSPTDLQDVSAAVYTYLVNGLPPAGNWTGLFEPGQPLRLRLINGAAMTVFDVRVPELPLTVVAADGQEVEPVEVDELRLAPAEICDVLVTPRESRAYTVFAQALDRSGFARGTLAPRVGADAGSPGSGAGVLAAVPALDPRPLLSMADMGMGPPDAAGRRLNDPGVGLRDNGRRVLTYADLRTLGGPLDARPPQREIELHLTGHMMRYVWGFDGRKFSDSEPIELMLGEHVALVLINDTMMTHPIHLHGMWLEVLDEAGRFQVRKHTVVVQPGQKLRATVQVDAPGSWAFHCHLMFHMEAGMFRVVRVVPAVKS